MIVLTVWKQQPGKYFCISSKSRGKTWRDKFFNRSELSNVYAYIQANLDKDLYWCPHGFSRPKRQKEFAVTPRLLWADLDEVNPETLALKPTVAWESSPGRWASLWVLNKANMTEEVNRRLTYAIGADPGGWDLSQVLRIPGTLNYKYASTPRVRLRWTDGPTYDIEKIASNLPAEKKDASAGNGVALAIYRKYEKKLPGHVRRELLKGRPSVGKRSEVFWRLVHSLLESGLSSDEAFELLKVSPWNKFADRRDGDTQLRREIAKATSEHLKDGGGGLEDDAVEYNFLARSMAEVEEEDVDWVWYPYLARGEVTILEGDPGLGKSFLAQMVARDICDGNKLPCVKAGLSSIEGIVAYFDLENSSGTVTKKRLMWNGCKRFDRFFQEEEPFSIDDEDAMEQVYVAIEKLKPVLVVFDTLNTYIGAADTHKGSESQQSFRRFKDIAKRFNCAVMVLRHLTKSSKERALYRGQGSIAFSGFARVVLTVGLMPDDEEDTRVMAVTKLNLAKIPRALTFRIEDGGQDRGMFRWGGFADVTSDDLVMTKPKNGLKEVDISVDWLRRTLSEGAMSFGKLKLLAEPKSISEKALYRAADELGVNRTKGLWSLPRS